MDRTQKVELTNLCMVTDAKGRLLVEDRLDPFWGGLCFPGGHVEKGESFRDAVIREVRDSEEGPVFWIDRVEIPGRRTVPDFTQLLRVMEDDSLSEMFYAGDELKFY